MVNEDPEMFISRHDSDGDGVLTRTEFWSAVKQVCFDLVFEESLQQDDPRRILKKSDENL